MLRAELQKTGTLSHVPTCTIFEMHLHSTLSLKNVPSQELKA